MRHPINLARVAFYFLATFALPLFAWSDLGHGVVGAIAEKSLSARAKTVVHSLLSEEPLALAATWPDLVRNDSRFKEFALYHFYELKRRPRATRDADTLITQAPKKIMSSDLNEEQKAILLRYLIHVVGDVHQPLHIGNGFDRGGNLCDVRMPSQTRDFAKIQSLHVLWDESLVNAVNETYFPPLRSGAKTYPNPGAFADKLMTEANSNALLADVSDLSLLPKENWYEESFGLHSSVYPDAAAGLTPQTRPYCRIVRLNSETHKEEVVDGAYNLTAIPEIDAAYIENSIPTVKKRLLLAGLRLARLINQMAEDNWDEQDQRDFFKPLLFDNVPEQGK